MLKEFEYGPFDTAIEIELRTKAEVEGVLREELSGNEDGATVVRRVHELMRELENCD